MGQQCVLLDLVMGWLDYCSIWGKGECRESVGENGEESSAVVGRGGVVGPAWDVGRDLWQARVQVVDLRREERLVGAARRLSGHVGDRLGGLGQSAPGQASEGSVNSWPW